MCETNQNVGKQNLNRMSDYINSKAPAKRASIVWQTFELLLVKHNVCQFAITQTFFDSEKQKMFLKLTNKMYLSSTVCHGGQTHKYA